MEKNKTWVDLHEKELFGGKIIPDDIQCKNCIFRTVILIDGKKCERYKNPDCSVYIGKATGDKPDEVLSGETECEFYEKGEPVPQEWVQQNHISPHNRD